MRGVRAPQLLLGLVESVVLFPIQAQLSVVGSVQIREWGVASQESLCFLSMELSDLNATVLLEY